MDLTGKLLIAMPGMGDPRFAHSVVYICAHSDEGAMGLIINQPAPDLKFADLLKQLKIEGPKPKSKSKAASKTPIHVGGPVEHGRGFVLHTRDYMSNSSTLGVDEVFGMTATLDILEDMARGTGPASALLALGYSGWGPGQLEAEIGQNGWLTTEASLDLVFATENPKKWQGALATLGVDPILLSADAGRA